MNQNFVQHKCVHLYTTTSSQELTSTTVESWGEQSCRQRPFEVAAKITHHIASSQHNILLIGSLVGGALLAPTLPPESEGMVSTRYYYEDYIMSVVEQAAKGG